MNTNKHDTDLGRAVKDTVKDARDTVREGMHRSAADAEHTRRDVEGDEMTAGEKITSGANEAKNRIQAEVDKGKRQVRDSTE
ncbi:MAG: hypothetical protein JO199_03860 [Candidatus Eremiobacteraeota bacterium]|nr:hypothetical protein [Candidatus Eremiobacteraeota bacterium]